jgi:hypothetical protein
MRTDVWSHAGCRKIVKWLPRDGEVLRILTADLASDAKLKMERCAEVTSWRTLIL